MQAEELVSDRIELFRPHAANDGTLLDNKDPAHQPANEIERLLDQHDCNPCLVTQRRQYLDDLFDDGGLDALGGLVDKQDGGPATETPGNGQYLLLAAAEHAANAAEQRAEPGNIAGARSMSSSPRRVRSALIRRFSGTVRP